MKMTSDIVSPIVSEPRHPLIKLLARHSAKAPPLSFAALPIYNPSTQIAFTWDELKSTRLGDGTTNYNGTQTMHDSTGSVEGWDTDQNDWDATSD
jgi:hypothetical protein